jgi:hypothetical protein
LKFELSVNPLEPEEAEIRIKGAYAAARNAEERCLNDAVDAVITGYDVGLESRYRELVPPRLRGVFEWAILCHEVLVGIKPSLNRDLQDKYVYQQALFIQV